MSLPATSSCPGDLVMDVFAVEISGARCTQLAWLKGTKTGGDDNGGRIEFGAGGCYQRETAIIFPLQPGHRLSEVKLRVKGLNLLHQPVDEFLCADHRVGGDIVNGFFRVQLATLTADTWLRSPPRAHEYPANRARIPGTDRQDRHR